MQPVSNNPSTKISPIVSLIDESTETALDQDLHLSVEVGIDGVTLGLLDLKRNKYLLLVNYYFQKVSTTDQLAAEIKKLFPELPYIKRRFLSCTCSIVSNEATLVPTPLFSNDKKEAYLKFTNDISPENGTIESDKLRNTDAYNVYFIPEQLQKTIKEFLPSVRFLHFSTPLIDIVPLRYKDENKIKVVVHVQASHLEVIVLEGKNLKFYNTFNYQATEDFIYYVLFVTEQLKLSPETMELVLIGEVEKNSAIYSIVHKYVRNIKFGERSDNFQYSYKLDSIPKHFYFNLFNQYLCV